MATASAHDRAFSQLSELLSSVRARLRRHIWLEGALAILALLFAAFWVTLGIDWTFEPPPWVRGLMLGVVGAGVCFFIERYWLRRLRVPVTTNNLAVLLERRYGNFRDSLITTVELDAQPVHAGQFHPDMLAATRGMALDQVREVSIDRLFDRTALTQKFLLAALLGGGMLVFALNAAEPFQVWVRRCLLLSPELWPRKTALSITGFADKVEKVGRGGEYTIVVQADPAKVVPEKVLIRYQYEDGLRESQPMEAARVTAPGEPRLFTFKMADLKQSVAFDISGGDARLSGYQIKVVDNPAVVEKAIQQTFPGYMGLSPATVKVTDAQQIRLATNAVIRARTNKPLASLRVQRIQGEDAATESLGYRLIDPTQFEVVLGPVLADQTITFSLTDTDGITSRDPARLMLSVLPDEPPQVGLRLTGIGNAITPQARLPLVGTLNDDYGISRVWVEYQIEQSADLHQRELILPPPRGSESVKTVDWNPQTVPDRYKEYTDEAQYLGLDLERLRQAAEAAKKNAAAAPAPAVPTPAAPESAAQPDQNPAAAGPGADAPTATPLTVKVGQKLVVLTKALDNSTLEKGPFLGAGERYTLEVVSPETLAAMLEAREVALRQRFERIIEEFNITRDDLYAMQFTIRQKSTETDLDELERGMTEGAPGTENAAGTGTAPTPAEQLEILSLERQELTNRSLEKLERSSFETLTVANAFLDILAEFENNRIGNEQIDQRLRQEIAQPLINIAEKIVPPATTAQPVNSQRESLKELLEQFKAVINDPVAGPRRQAECVELADKILSEMRGVLDKMLELEDYNALLAKLRKLIEEQNQLNDKTRQEQKRQLLEGT
ncbi:MAG: hypothetical protein SFX18_04300 [Pirellulales bacterium]|nr:hypothetical protein [Pirellulales bacterium]